VSPIAGKDIAQRFRNAAPQRQRTTGVCGRNIPPTTSKTASERPAWPRANPNATGGRRRRWRIGHAAAHPRTPLDPEDPAMPYRAQIRAHKPISGRAARLEPLPARATPGDAAAAFRPPAIGGGNGSADRRRRQRAAPPRGRVPPCRAHYSRGRIKPPPSAPPGLCSAAVEGSYMVGRARGVGALRPLTGERRERGSGVGVVGLIDQTYSVNSHFASNPTLVAI
jgi:hypothetical protein